MNRAISLDFWGTVAVFNPEYAAARTKFFAALFNLPDNEAHARYQFIKRRCDHDAEVLGTAITPLVAIKQMLEGQVTPTNASLDHRYNAVDILEALENLVRKHPPLLHPEIVPTIIKLQERGFRVGVASNTNFIAGALVQEIFDIPWDFAAYSDVIGVSKPDPDFFRTVIKQCAAFGIPRGDITHIGDNTVCDVYGARDLGMNTILTKSPEETIDILNEIGDIK